MESAGLVVDALGRVRDMGAGRTQRSIARRTAGSAQTSYRVVGLAFVARLRAPAVVDRGWMACTLQHAT